MSNLDLFCPECNNVFPSGIKIDPGNTAAFINSDTRCGYCGSQVRIPDGSYDSDSKGVIHFRKTVSSFINELESKSNPLEEAKKILETLQTIQKNGPKKISWAQKIKYKKWIPNSPEKVAAYIVIVHTIIQLMTKNPTIKIDYNTFINEYNQVNITEVLKMCVNNEN